MTVLVIQQGIPDTCTSEVGHGLVGIVLHDDVQWVGRPARIGSVVAVLGLSRMVYVFFFLHTKFADVFLHGNPFYLNILMLGIELGDGIVGAREAGRDFIILFNHNQTVFGGFDNFLRDTFPGDGHTNGG